MSLSNYKNTLKNEFKGYNALKLQKDLLAGLTCTAVAIPLALAFGVSSGADAASGLICAIIAGIVIGLLSGASYQLSGPTGAMAAILFSLVATYGLEGMFFASFLSGVILLLFSLLRAGKLVYFIPKPVITGFTSGIAIVIALGQVDNCFGTFSEGASALEKLLSYSYLGFDINYYALFITLAVILIMAFWPRKVQKYFPSSLFVIILFLIVNMVFRLPVAVVGEIPRTLLPESRLILSKVDFSNFTAYLSPAFSIAVLGMVESLLCGASAGKMKGEKLDAGQELFAQGIGNMIIPFFGGVPATAAIARTSVAIKSGGQTRLVSVFHSLGLLASMLLLAPYMAMIPLSALGGVLMVTAFRMNEWQEIRIIFKKKLKTSMAQFLITLIATVLLDLTSAILLGVGVSMVIMVVRLRSEVHVTIDETENESIFVMNVSGALFFACQDTMEKMVLKLYERGAKVIILNLAGVTFLDHSEAEEFEEIYREMTRNGVRIIFAGMSKEVHTMFSRVGFYDEISQEDKKSSIMEALKDIDLVKKN